MLSKTKIIIILTFLLLSSYSAIGLSKENIIDTSVHNLSFKQEIDIPIGTSLEHAKYQPIDIVIEFDNKCWAKNEKEHSVRVAYDDGTGLTEIESQIYNLEHTNENFISQCSLVFIIPKEANGKERYYVLYDSSETKAPDYEKHITIEDTTYFYEPISGQKIDISYYGIRQNGEVIYAIIQTGELLGNPVSLSVGKFKPGTKVVETHYLEQLGTFDIRTGTYKEPGYIGSSWAESIEKSILVDGNLMARVRLVAKSPKGDLVSDNIYTYYYNPSDTKSIIIDFTHESLKDIHIEDSEVFDGAYAGIVSIKSRSATIEKMNTGEILPELRVYCDDDQIRDFGFPTDPDSIEKHIILGTQADINIGGKGWICSTDPKTGLANGLILGFTEGITDNDYDGAQVKAWARQNVNLPGLIASTGNLYFMRNAYRNGKHITKIPQGFKASGTINFITVQNEGYELIDKNSELFQKLVKIRSPVRADVDIEEEKDRYNLDVYVHFASSLPMGALLSAVLGRKIPYIYAEIYKEDSLRSAGSTTRLPISTVDLDLEDKNIFEKIKTIVNIFDWRNISLFKKISFPNLVEGNYVIKVFRENPFFSNDRQMIGYKTIDVKENSSTRVFCTLQGSTIVNVIDQKDNYVEDVKVQLRYNNENISMGFTDKNGSVQVFAPCYPRKPYKLRVLYQGFLVDEKDNRFGILRRFIPTKEDFSIKRYNLEIKIKDSWGLNPAVDLNPVVTSEEMFEPISISAKKIDDGVYVFENLYKANYILRLGYKDLSYEKKLTIDKDTSINIDFNGKFKLSFNIMDSFGQKIDEGSISISRKGIKESFNICKEGQAEYFLPPGEYFIEVFSEEGVVARQKLNVQSHRTVDIVSTKGSFFHLFLTILGILIGIIGFIYFSWKRDFKTALKILIIGLLLVALVSSWWTVSGEMSNVSTETKTLLIPSNIITVTEAAEGIGGEISAVPEEITMVQSLVSYLIIISIIVVLFSIFIKNRFKRTNILLTVLAVALILISISVFYYAISQLAEVSVGSFMGSGNLDVSIPGAHLVTVDNSWGPGLGFILSIFAIVFSVISLFIDKIKDKYF